MTGRAVDNGANRLRAGTTSKADVVLSIEDLVVTVPSGQLENRVVNSVSFGIGAQETVALVGESGSGKTMTALAIMGLTPGGRAAITAGRVWFDGRDLCELSDRELRAVRGGAIAMVFQDPLTALDPLVTVGRQVATAIRVHSSLGRRERRQRVVDLLVSMGIPDASSCFRRYPHEYSGGMRQRVLIAMAMANNPTLYIADEPTTALDVTIQAQVLDALESARAGTKSAMLLITHDLGVVAERADRVAVMYAGRLVEQGPVREVLAEPRHPYTLGLLGSTRSVDERRPYIATIPGQPAAVEQLPSGCAFHPRCAWAIAECRVTVPRMERLTEVREAACFRSGDVSLGDPQASSGGHSGGVAR